MALPKLEVPKYSLTIPSTGDVVEYRPFLVKEEKILMIAQETGGDGALYDAMIEIVEACTFNKLDLLQLQTYDVEYVFLQIRAKSVGETSSITIKCEECGHRVPVTINLEDAYVQTSDDFQQEKTIEITDGIGITLEGLSLAKARSIDPNSTDLTKTVKLFIKSIYDTDGVYLASESSDEEMTTFVESLPHKVSLSNKL